jgi:hypothetical protein
MQHFFGLIDVEWNKIAVRQKQDLRAFLDDGHSVSRLQISYRQKQMFQKPLVFLCIALID